MEFWTVEEYEFGPYGGTAWKIVVLLPGGGKRIVAEALNAEDANSIIAKHNEAN